MAEEQSINILLLEDNPTDVKLLERQLKKAELTFQLHTVDSRSEFLKGLLRNTPDVILSDHALPGGFNSLDALQLMHERGYDLPFILVTGSVSEEFAVQAMKAGADDYILKDSLVRLPAAIQNSLAKRRMKREKEMVEILNARLQAAYREIEQMHKDITDSISYARRIQEALLPPKELLTRTLPGSFILYLPRDIISGDFYWFAEVRGKFVIAVADCTGHGVPGALMSMIGHNLLNEIVISRKFTQPDHVLEKLHTGICRLLKQDAAAGSSHDGMDISLCTIDRKAGTIDYAGANRHLYYFRGKEFKLIKGDRKGVGGFHPRPGRTYTNHAMRYEPGDTFFLFTDGYPDQIGERKGKRMQTRNLVKLLQSTMNFGMVKQEEFLVEWLQKWRGKERQTDDILVVGVRL